MAAEQPTKAPKASRREFRIRLLWALCGGLGAVIGGIAVNVIAEQINNAIEASPPTREGCLGSSTEGSILGHQNLFVELSKDDDNCWQNSLDDIRPGDSFDVLIAYKNATGKQVDDVWIQAFLPEEYALVPGSTRYGNTSHPAGVSTTDQILDPGLNLGSYLHGANLWIIFEARMLPDADVECSLKVNAVYARLAGATEPDNAWKSVALVQPGRC